MLKNTHHIMIKRKNNKEKMKVRKETCPQKQTKKSKYLG